MKTLSIFSVLALTICLAGCGGVETETKIAPPPEAPHSHGDNDVLVWALEETADGTDIELKLGHHGDHFHGGDIIEPAISIIKGGKVVADAKVFNKLVDPADKETTIGREWPTIFEPETEEEIAHYAQAALKIPDDAKSIVIRYRMEIPGHEEEITRDVTVKVGH